MISSFLAGFPGGLIQADRLNQERQSQQTLETLRQLALQKSQQQEQGEGLAAKFALNYDPSQAPQAPPMAPLGNGTDLSSALSGIGGLPPGISRDSSGHLTRNGQPPDTMLPGGIPAWKSGDGMVSGLPPQGAVPLPRFQDAIYGLETDRGRNVSTSSAGALGPMQVMPDTARQYGFTPEQAATSREPGNAIAADLYKRYGGNTDLAAIAYNAGPGRADAIQKGAPLSSLPGETQNYLAKLHRDLDMEVGQKGVELIQKGVPVPAVQAATDLAKRSGREIDPQQWGMAGLHQMMQAIDKLDPGAPDAVKWIALGQVNKILAPEEKLRAQMYAKDHQQELALIMKDLQIGQAQAGQAETKRHHLEEEAAARTRAESDKGGQIFQSGDKFFRATPQGNVQPLDLPAGATKAGTQPRNAPAMALRTFMEEFQAREGRAPSSEEIRNFQAASAEALSEARTIGTSSANLERASNAAAALIPLVRETSKSISRTNYPDVNSLILAYETKTGDPKVVQYGEMVNSLRYLYARALAPSGQGPRVADINHFDQIFNKAWSEGQVDAALDQIERAIGIEKGATQRTKSEILGKPTEKGAAPNVPMMTREQIQQQLAPDNWSKLTPEQQSAVARRVEELERGLK